ncbi:acyl transferase/acyl hydrolase/lysophospholipase [Xylogone sp. PMI_703]|nr:acyl transferase/acyl hydrolase/lysophospholipase [Xylogone sp. PMI_703]
MYGFTAFISGSKKLGLWDCLTWTAGVSGSCWTLAAYYTIANHDISKLIRHYLTIAAELVHPMSVYALDTVVRSSKGVYFLIGPLVRKVRSGIIGLGIMDLYATLTTTYQLLLREPKARLSRATFQFSKVWTRSGIDRGIEPMPILTAVRRAPRNSSGVKPHTDSSLSKGQPRTQALAQHRTPIPNAIAHLQYQQSRNNMSLKSSADGKSTHVDPPNSSLSKGFFQWFEVSPLEVGSPDVQGYIPTWSWGRSFVSGRSIGRQPEQSLSLLLGQCTGAPAGPLTGYISALLASLPKGTVMSRLLLLLNDFVRMKKWERLWGNPIRAGHDPNPFFGHNSGSRHLEHNDPDARFRTSSLSKQERTQPRYLGMHSMYNKHGGPEVTPSMNRVIRGNTFHTNSRFLNDSREKDLPSLGGTTGVATSTYKWESEGRIRLMDSGMSNNLPTHILARPERCADIIIAFDASSDVQTKSAFQRIRNFAEDCHLKLEDHTALFDPPESRFRIHINDTENAAREVENKFLHHYTRVFRCERENGETLYLIYCPLLPNSRDFTFDPSTASFSNSYNLVWTPEQVQTLFDTSESNLSDYSIKTIKQVVKRVYLAKRERRLGSASPSY